MRDRGIYGQWDASDDISKESNHQQKIKQSVWAEEIETLTPQAEVWCRKEEHSSLRFNLGNLKQSQWWRKGCQHKPGAWIYVTLWAVWHSVRFTPPISSSGLQQEHKGLHGQHRHGQPWAPWYLMHVMVHTSTLPLQLMFLACQQGVPLLLWYLETSGKYSKPPEFHSKRGKEKNNKRKQNKIDVSTET